MPIQFRSSEAATNAVANSAVTRPAGVVVGDMLLAQVHVQDWQIAVTPPSGWTQVRADNGATSAKAVRSVIFAKVATASEPATYTFTLAAADTSVITVLAYSGVASVGVNAGLFTDTGSLDTPAPSITTTTPGCKVVAFYACRAGNTYSTPTGTVARRTTTTGGNSSSFVVDFDQPNAGATGTKVTTKDTTVYSIGQQVALVPANTAPNAPIASVPAVIDRLAVNRISVPFNDSDPGDSQSQLDIQWWDLDGTGARTGTVHTYSQVNPIQYWDSPASTFTLGAKEIQGKSYDAQGLASPWGASTFFTVADAPPAPTITTPINGGTVSSAEPFTWSTPNQDAYQVQVLDGGTTVSDTGEVTSATIRTVTLTFATNNVARTLKVRVKKSGLWSAWATISVTVSYTRGPDPVVTATPNNADGNLTVGITNPVPGAGEPAAAYNNVWIDDGDGKGEIRKATLLPTNTPWVYDLPRSGWDYSGNIRVEVVAVNGTTASGTA